MLDDHQRHSERLSKVAQVSVPFLNRCFPAVRNSTKSSMFLFLKAWPFKGANHANEHTHGPDQAVESPRGVSHLKLLIGLAWSLAISAVLWVVAFYVVRSLIQQ